MSDEINTGEYSDELQTYYDVIYHIIGLVEEPVFHFLSNRVARNLGFDLENEKHRELLMQTTEKVLDNVDSRLDILEHKTKH